MKTPELYYYAIDGKTFGPFTKQEFDELNLPNNTYICNNLDMTWRLLNKGLTIDKNHINQFEKSQTINNQGINETQKKISRFNLEKKDNITKDLITNNSNIENHPTGEIETTNKKSNSLLYLSITSFLIIGGVLFFFLWLKPYLRDKNALRMYSYVNSLVLRSSPIPGVDYNTMDNIKFGSELIVYSNSGEWVNCKYNNNEGYASNKYLLNKEDFFILNSAFGDQASREVIETAKCRKAILLYYKSKNIIGNLDQEIQKDIWGSTKDVEQWVIYAKPKNIKPNSIIFPRAISKSSKFTDFGFIITNIKTGSRKFILYTFSDNEDPILITEQDAPDTGDIEKVDTEFINNQYITQVTYTL